MDMDVVKEKVLAIIKKLCLLNDNHEINVDKVLSVTNLSGFSEIDVKWSIIFLMQDGKILPTSSKTIKIMEQYT